jgi:hypothetical protein
MCYERTKSKLIILLEVVMVTKPWYVKKPVQSFFRQKSHRSAWCPRSLKNRRPKEVRLRLLRKIGVFSPAAPPHPRTHSHGDWQRHGVKSLAPLRTRRPRARQRHGKGDRRSSRISYLGRLRQAGIRTSGTSGQADRGYLSPHPRASRCCDLQLPCLSNLAGTRSYV